MKISNGGKLNPLAVSVFLSLCVAPTAVFGTAFPYRVVPHYHVHAVPPRLRCPSARGSTPAAASAAGCFGRLWEACRAASVFCTSPVPGPVPCVCPLCPLRTPSRRGGGGSAVRVVGVLQQ